MRRELAPLDKKARKLLEPAIPPSERILAGARGLNSAIVATSHRIFICKWGIASGAFLGSKVNAWEFTHITGIEYRHGVGSDAIVIQSAGALPVTNFGSMDKGPASVWEAPNALFLLGSDGAEFSTLLRNITASYERGMRFDNPQAATTAPSRAHAAGVAPTAPPLHPADEIRKFAALRDEGLISEAEFQVRKASILASGNS